MTIQDPKLAQYRRLVRIGFAVISTKNTVTSMRTKGKTRRIAYFAEGEISLFPISRAAILSSIEELSYVRWHLEANRFAVEESFKNQGA